MFRKSESADSLSSELIQGETGAPTEALGGADVNSLHGGMSLQTALVPELLPSPPTGAAQQSEREPPRLLTAVVLLLALSVAGGLGAVGRAMSLACTTPCMRALGYQGCLGWYPTLGCAHLVFALPLAAIATSALTVELSRAANTVRAAAGG